MRALPESLAASLASGATTLCHCWRIERRDGAVFGFTDHDRALVFGGETYEPETGAAGSAIEAGADLAVDNAEIEGLLSSQRLSAAALASGRFDGAAVEIWRVDWRDTASRVLLKRGTIGEIVREGASFRAEIRGGSAALSRVRGRVYGRLCDAVVGDARCGVDSGTAAFRGEGAVTAVLDEQRFLASGLGAFEAGWFAHGRLDWTGGANAGTSAHVKAHGDGASGASLSLWLPPGLAIAEGDAFEIRAGCDRRHETCAAKFSNLVNFRGFHLMLGNDAAMSYPLRSDRNDGGKR